MEQKLIAASVKAERWDPEKQNFEETESVLAALGFADWRTLPRVISIVGAGGKTSTMYDLAEELAAKTVSLFSHDIKSCGEMHEYYHPETGEPVINSGFQNWNLLALNMGAWVARGNAVTEENWNKEEPDE